MPASEIALPLRIGARTLWTVRRRLQRHGLTLAQGLGEDAPVLPPLGPEDDGYLVTALPAARVEALVRHQCHLKPFVRQQYQRSFARLDLGFDAWLATCSAKSRSTLRRKARKLAERSGGALDLRCYKSEVEIGDFYNAARAVSALTYQERLLDAGLPSGPEALERMRTLARGDQARGWLLFVDGRPISYLYAPAQGDTLIYAFLGYDPDFADFSPGTVLQFEAMRQLMDEGRFRLFDFTEGEGQHKRQFSTGGVDCVDLLLVRPTFANLLTGPVLTGFDRAVAFGKRAASVPGLEPLARKLRRRD